MKLHLNNSTEINLFTSHGPGFVKINQVEYRNSLVVLPNRLINPWGPATFAELSDAHFAELTDLGVEILLLGTGQKLRFPAPALLQSLIAAQIGLEVMDTLAACRTYNILANEDRKVGVALLIEHADNAQ